MTASPSIFSLAASGVYGLVLLACMVAAITSAQHRQPAQHLRTWLLIGAVFVLLAVVRITAAEEAFRDSLRTTLRLEGEYRARRSFQAPLVASILVIGTLFAGALLYWWAPRVRGRRNVFRAVAIFATFSILFLMLLRLASLHAVDALLYGPLKLNWVIDIGTSVAVIVCAIQYVRLVRARP